MFISQTAHQASARPTDLGGVQAQPLLLRHLDGHGLEVFQKPAAAERLTAKPQAAQHLALIAHADLAQLDAGVELRCQILDQLAEIDPVVSGEIKHQLAAVQRVLGIDQLHFQVMGGNALLTDMVRLLHIGAVLAHTAHVHGIRHADDRLDLAGEARHLMRGADDLAAFGAAGRCDDHKVALLDLELARVKIVRPAIFFKFNGNYFHGSVLLLLVYKKISVGVGVPDDPGTQRQMFMSISPPARRHSTAGCRCPAGCGAPRHRPAGS